MSLPLGGWNGSPNGLLSDPQNLTPFFDIYLYIWLSINYKLIAESKQNIHKLNLIKFSEENFLRLCWGSAGTMQHRSAAEFLLPCIQAEAGNFLIWAHSSLKELPSADHVSYNVLKHWTQNLKVLVAQSCLDSLWPHGCTLPGSSVPGILQARILEWVVIPFSRGSSQPKDQTRVSYTADGFLTIWVTRESYRRENNLQKGTFKIPTFMGLQSSDSGEIYYKQNKDVK